MRYIHRIAFRGSVSQRKQVESMGVEILPSMILEMPVGLPHVSFDLAEDHPNWPALRDLFANWDALGMQWTEFSKSELRNASWLNLVPDWHHGYPQPRDNEFGYLEATYDLTDYCVRCGIGNKQKAPFQMKGEPKWGRRNILQLNWVFDEYFVTPEAWASVFKPHGILARPVLNNKQIELNSVVQLVVDEHVGVVTERLTKEEQACTVCGRTKYLPVARGPFPLLVIEPSTPMAKTNEYFGSGASANKGVIVSHALFRDMQSAGMRGVSFRPVADSDS